MTRFIFILFFLLNFIVFSQTKEENKTWIKENLEKYGGTQESVYQNVYFVGCKVFYREKFSGSPYTFSKHFDANDVKNWKINENEIQADSNIIESRNDYNLEIEYIDQIYIRDKEENIKPKMIKVLSQLASFCEINKKETF